MLNRERPPATERSIVRIAWTLSRSHGIGGSSSARSRNTQRGNEYLSRSRINERIFATVVNRLSHTSSGEMRH
jgi:hypothetical protein